MDSSYYVQINVSVRRDIICDIIIHGIHKRGVGIVLLLCVQMRLSIILRLTSLMTTRSILVRVYFVFLVFQKWRFFKCYLAPLNYAFWIAPWLWKTI